MKMMGRLTGEYGKIGGRLNQIVRYFNGDGVPHDKGAMHSNLSLFFIRDLSRMGMNHNNWYFPVFGIVYYP